jgi:lysophospholipase L1-like esterase
MRICFIGDSIVNGAGDDDALGWVGRVVAAARHRGRDVTAYNLGIRRDTSADVAARWSREARARLPADCDGRLVFSFGTNDCVSTTDGPRVAHGASVANAEAILDAARRWLPTLMVGPAIVADDPVANARIVALSGDYAALCARLAIPYLEICHVLAASPAWTEEALAGDGAHPKSAGYAVLAAAVSEWPPWVGWCGARHEAGR